MDIEKKLLLIADLPPVQLVRDFNEPFTLSIYVYGSLRKPEIDALQAQGWQLNFVTSATTCWTRTDVSKDDYRL